MASCPRRAWLVLGDREIELEDPEGSYGVEELNLGAPEVRDVVTNRPDFSGTDDRTRLMGARVVSVNITAWHGRRTIDDVARQFGPFLVPSARPELHWVLDTPENGYAERFIRLRASAYSAPVTGPYRRSIQLAWVAPDPTLWDPRPYEAISRPFLPGVRFGRRYDLIFDRVYPAMGGGGAATPGVFRPVGDVNVYPRIRIVGPILAPVIQVLNWPLDAVGLTTRFEFDVAFRLDVGRWVEIDSTRRTVTLDNGANALNRVRWRTVTGEFSEWPVALSAPNSRPDYAAEFRVSGGDVTSNSQAIAYWHAGYLM